MQVIGTQQSRFDPCTKGTSASRHGNHTDPDEISGSEQRLVSTPAGDARLIVDRAPRRARATLVLGHGAGGGAGARDLVVLAEALPAAGFTVVRVEQPWRVAGKRVAPAPATLDRGWLGALAHLEVAGALLVGGRSAGARVACRTALALGAAGCVALAFPLNPPRRAGSLIFD